MVADLGEAELRLQIGDPGGALELYERAMFANSTDRQRRLARVGADAALEELRALAPSTDPDEST